MTTLDRRSIIDPYIDPTWTNLAHTSLFTSSTSSHWSHLCRRSGTLAVNSHHHAGVKVRLQNNQTQTMSDVPQDTSTAACTGRELYGGRAGDNHTVHITSDLPESTTDFDHSSRPSFHRSESLAANAGQEPAPGSREDWTAMQAFNVKDEHTMTTTSQDAVQNLVYWKTEDGFYDQSMSTDFCPAQGQAISNRLEDSEDLFPEQDQVLHNWQVNHESAPTSTIPPQFLAYHPNVGMNHPMAALMAHGSLAMDQWGMHQTGGNSTVNLNAIDGGTFHQMNSFPATVISNASAFNDEDDQVALYHSGLPFSLESCGLYFDGTLATSTSAPSDTMSNSFTTTPAPTSWEVNTPSYSAPSENENENEAKVHRQRRPRPIMYRPSGKDEALLEYKRQGFSYKQIKVLGNFEEAESTLRGRYRTLTKPKEERVRKPQWKTRDIELLREGVRAFSGASADISDNDLPSSGLQKIAWKKVAGYIFDNGGSYQFGNATCKKKWYEICGSSD